MPHTASMSSSVENIPFIFFSIFLLFSVFWIDPYRKNYLCTSTLTFLWLIVDETADIISITETARILITIYDLSSHYGLSLHRRYYELKANKFVN